MEYTVARRDGSDPEQLAWERLQTLVADYIDADALGRRAQATTFYLRGVEEFGDEQWEHARDYAMEPEVRFTGLPGYVGGIQ